MIEKVNKEIYNEDNMMNSKEISTFFLYFIVDFTMFLLILQIQFYK